MSSMRDRLFIEENEIDLAPGTVIALTMQINDIAELANRQGNFSNQFKVPRNANNIHILDSPGEVQTTSEKPYRKLNAKVIKDGTAVIQKGFAIIDRADEFFNVVVYSGNVNFFDLLENKKIGDLDLSAYNHTYNHTNIVNARANTYVNGYKYPVIDYGKLDNTPNRKVKTSNLKPATFVLTILNRIAIEAGFAFDFSTFIFDKIEKLMVPFTNKAFAIPDALRALLLWDVDMAADYNSGARVLPFTDQTSVTIGNTTYITPQHFNAGIALNPYPFDNIVTDTGGNFNTSTHRARVNVATRQRFHFKNHVEINVTGGTRTPPLNNASYQSQVSVITKIYRNGSLISGGLNVQPAQLFTTNGSQTFDFDVDYFCNWLNMNVGDIIIAQQFITIQYYNSAYTIPTGTDDASFTVICSVEEFNNEIDSNIAYNAGLVTLNTILPDMEQKDFIKQIAYLTAGMFATNPFTNKIYFNSFHDIVLNIPFAIDWSDKLDMKLNPVMEYRLGKYCQKNNFKFKEDENDEEIKQSSPGLGNGFLIIDDTTLPKETDVLEMLFAASIMEKKLDNLDVVLIRKMSETSPTDDLTIETEPRILIDDTQDVGLPKVDFLDDLGNTIKTINNIPLCYFVLNSKSFNLGFNNSVLDDSYPGLASVLNRTKKITVMMKLDASDITALDEVDEASGEIGWFVPRYFRQFSANFYINKIMNFTGNDKLTKVELIRL